MKLLCLFFLNYFFINITPQDELAIRGVLNKQVKCWNEGNIECFMEGYWQSEQLTFIGKSGVKRGWTTTLNNYKTSYPNRKVMGMLNFDLLKINHLADNHWLVIGKWNIERSQDNVGGFFSLIFNKIDEKWVIISDHSS